MAQGWIHSPLKTVSEWGQRTCGLPLRQPDPTESPFYGEGWVEKIWCSQSVLGSLPPLRCTTKILLKFPWQSWIPNYQGRRDRKKKVEWKEGWMEEGWPVPVPCECLTSSGGSENAGLCPSVFFFFNWFNFGGECSMQHLIFPEGTKPMPPALGAQSPNHWTTREVPAL